MNSRRTFLSLLGASFSTTLFARPALAHPSHVSLCEATHNRAQGTLDLSLRATPEDLEAALRKHSKREFKIDSLDPAKLDRHLAAYLKKRMIVCDRVPTRLPLSIVGHELDMRWAWVHFQFPVGSDASLDGFHVENRVFMEIVPSQANRMLLRHGGRTDTLIFRHETPSFIVGA